MERRRRRYGPLQGGCPFAPWISAYALTRQQGVERDKDEKYRRGKRNVAANRGDEVPAGESLRIVRDAPRHASKSQKMHREECQVDPDEGGPEMDLAEGLVVLSSAHLADPVIETGEDAEHRTKRQRIMEMRHHVVRVVQRMIDTGVR